jgi:hypothetical protein
VTHTVVVELKDQYDNNVGEAEVIVKDTFQNSVLASGVTDINGIVSLSYNIGMTSLTIIAPNCTPNPYTQSLVYQAGLTTEPEIIKVSLTLLNEGPYIDIVDNYNRQKGYYVNCVWCGKLSAIKEVDSHNRCSFDSDYPFTEEGRLESLRDRGMIAEYMIYTGKAIPA